MENKKELKRGRILAALMLTMTLAAMDSTIVSTAIPQIVSDLGGFTKFSWVFSIYLLAQTVTIPIYGKFSDIFGRKKILIFGIIVFLIGSATSAAAWDIYSLIIFRGIQGLGGGSIMATVNTIAGDIYSVGERARIQGYLSSIWGISAIIGPALGGFLAEFVNWRWIFIINLPFGILSIFFIYKYFIEEVHPGKPKIDYKGTMLIMITLSMLFVLLLESGQSWDWISVQSISLLALIILMIFWTYQTEKKSEDAIMPLWVWKNRTLAFNNLAVAGMGIIMMGPEIFLPTFSQASLGLGIITSGFILASMSIGWPVASGMSGRLYMKIGFRETSLIGTALILIACVGFLLIPKPQPIYLLVIDQVLIGAGFGLLSTPTLVSIQSMVKWQQRGVVTGANVFTRNLGQSLGAAIVGAIFNTSFLKLLSKAPSELEDSGTNILGKLNDPAISESSKVYLRDAVNESMRNIYWGLVIFTLITIYLLYKIPKRVPGEETLIEL